MKWFKHMTDASDDEFIAMLEAEFGDWGYARWWRLLEVVGAQMKPGCCRAVAKYPPRKWKELLRGSPKKLQLFFNFLQTSCKVSANFSEKVWEIEIPKLLELRDNYTKDYQETGKKLSNHTETDPEKESEEEGEPEKPPAPLETFELPDPAKPDFLVSLKHALGRRVFWAMQPHRQPEIVKQVNQQIDVVGFDVLVELYAGLMRAAGADYVIDMRLKAGDRLASLAPKFEEAREERQKDQARTESPAGKIKARHDEARALQHELVLTAKNGSRWVIEVLNINSMTMQPVDGGEKESLNGALIASKLGKYAADDSAWSTQPREVIQR